MNIEEIAALKAEAEREIHEVLDKLQQKTRMRVRDVDWRVIYADVQMVSRRSSVRIPTGAAVVIGLQV